MENLTKAPSIAKKGTFPATVVKVIDPFKIIINKGEKDGIRYNQKVLLYQITTDEIIDPNTGESLGFWEITKGTGRVINVQENMATIESDRILTPKSSIFDKEANIDSSVIMEYYWKILESEKIHYTQKLHEIEKLLPKDERKVPFNNPQVGDKVKPI